MASGDTLQLVTFHLDNEEFGVDIKKVQEINRMIDITKIPNSPNYVQGVVNLRGKIIPVVNLRTKLGLPNAEHDKSTRIIVLELDGMVLGFIVDSVSEVMRIPDANVEPAPAITGSTDTKYIEGVINLSDRILIILDLKMLLSDGTNGLRQAA